MEVTRGCKVVDTSQASAPHPVEWLAIFGEDLPRGTCGEGSCGIGMGGLQRGWLDAGAGKTRPLGTVWLEAPGATVKV